MAISDELRRKIGLPVPMFLYTLDQIRTMIGGQGSNLFWYEGRSIGIQPRDKIRAINIAGIEEKPDWRVEETEFIRWAKHKKFRRYENTFGLT